MPLENETETRRVRSRAFMPARDLARSFSGGPSLLVSARLIPDAHPDKRAFGLDTILVNIRDSDSYFFRAGDTGGDTIELAELPGDILAIVVAAADEAASLSRLWNERGFTQSPPMIVAETLLDAFSPVIECLTAETAAVSARCADLQRQLVTTRMEYEETRGAMWGLMRTLSHRYANKMELVASAPPGADGAVVPLAPSPLHQVIGAAVENITALAFHIPRLAPGGEGVLHVTVIGAESGRVVGAWRIPAGR
jgi:hypothetical protein